MGSKREPRDPASGGDLLDPESFWNEVADSPPATRADQDGDAPEDTEVLVVSAPRPAQAPRRASPAPGPAAPRPAPTGARRAPPPLDLSVRPAAARRPRPAPPPPGLGGLEEEPTVEGPAGGAASPPDGAFARLARIVLPVLGVAAASALLGWFLVGRFADEPAEPSPAPVAEASAAPGPQGPREAPREPAREAVAAAAHPNLAEPTVELTVLSDPPSAEVLVNGQFRGLTPVSVHRLPRRGEITLRVQSEGYQPWEQRVALAEAQPELQITAGLIKSSACPKGEGWIYVTTEPAGASVDLDGKRRPGQTPLILDKICAGPHEVLVQAPGRQAWRGQVDVLNGAVKNLTLELKP